MHTYLDYRTLPYLSSPHLALLCLTDLRDLPTQIYLQHTCMHAYIHTNIHLQIYKQSSHPIHVLTKLTLQCIVHTKP